MQSHTRSQYSPLAVSPQEASRMLGIGRTKLYGEIRSGALQSFKLGNRRLISMAALYAWLSAHEVGGATNAY